jgi:hypothetical protein
VKRKSLFLWGEPVMVTDRTQVGTDPYGDPQYKETHTEWKGAFSLTDTVEKADGTRQVTDQPNVLLPPAASVDSNSTVTVRGRDWQVKGTPQVWHSPLTGWDAGIKIMLETTAG